MNCTIVNNMATNNGGGMRRCDGTITNCIIWGNSIDNLFECSPLAYCCYPGAIDEGNISTGPMFVDSNNGDYHLKSEYGQWNLNSSQWVYDTNTSPCIDVGDSASDWTEELWPHEGRVNMGVYGGTA